MTVSTPPGEVTTRAHDLVAAHAAATPLAPALVAPDATLGYADLLAGADRVAAALHGLGVGDGDLVGVCLGRCAALPVTLLGVLRAGAVSVALDPAHPQERLRATLADSGAVALVAAAGTGGGTPLAGVGELVPLAPATRRHEPGVAYVIYTSGSTGTPKGVLVEHAGLANLAAWHRRAFAVTPADRCAQVASPGFDASVWEIWGALTAGAALHVPPEGLKTDPAGLRDWLVAEGITVTFLPTPLAEAVLALEWPDDTRLRVLLTGGDRLHRSPPEGLPFTVVNNYGVTEASVVSTSAPVPAGVPGTPSIGAAVDGVELRIVDADLAPVPAGTAGELLVGGVSVARGYLGAPEATARRFVTLPGSPSRWYRTGDVVRQRADGELDYVNRLDDQVQVRGFRVEPGEIVAALDRHPDVSHSEVVALQDESGNPRLVAYLQRSGAETDPDDEAMAAHVGAHLPAHMVPTAFVWLDRMPVGPNGKVDRAALRPPPAPRAAAGRAPEGELEVAVAHLVAGLLGHASVGADDNFLLLGGHSLLGAQLIMRIGETFGVEMSLRSLFENPTVARIATVVHAALVEQVIGLSDDDATELTRQLASTE